MDIVKNLEQACSFAIEKHGDKYLLEAFCNYFDIDTLAFVTFLKHQPSIKPHIKYIPRRSELWNYHNPLAEPVLLLPHFIAAISFVNAKNSITFIHSPCLEAPFKQQLVYIKQVLSMNNS